MLIDLLMGGGAAGQFLGQKGGIGWRLRKIVGRRANGPFPRGRSHIRKGIIFHGQELFVVIRTIRLPE